MHHIAILNKKLNLLPKILSGEKTIESRWYKFKKAPYEAIKAGDIVFFKNAGEPVTVKSSVKKAIFFDNLNNAKIKDILQQYGEKIGVPISYAKKIADKKYCILVFLSNVKRIKSFNIDKTGYGNMAAWLTVEDIKKIKK